VDDDGETRDITSSDVNAYLRLLDPKFEEKQRVVRVSVHFYVVLSEAYTFLIGL